MTDPEDYFTTRPPMAAYVPSKTALNSLTVQYAKELRSRDILVNAADPGPCATDFTTSFPGLTRTAADGALAPAVRRVLGLLDPAVAEDETVVAAVLAQVEEVGRS